MPRRSAAALAMAPLVDVRMKRLPCPRDLDPSSREIWTRLTATCRADHFRAADTELLRCYCENAVLAQEAFREMQAHGRIVDNKPSPWLMLLEKSTRALASLAPRLRLGPSARLDPKTVARRAPPTFPSPWIGPREPMEENDDARTTSLTWQERGGCR
jgi:phage terminase small subunit